MDKKELLMWLDKLVSASSGVMSALQTYGGSVAPHLLDNDKNDGERIRECLLELDKLVEIRHLIESSGEKRTVSRELINAWAQKILIALPSFPLDYLSAVAIEAVEIQIRHILSGLEIEVKP